VIHKCVGQVVVQATTTALRSSCSAAILTPTQPSMQGARCSRSAVGRTHTLLAAAAPREVVAAPPLAAAAAAEMRRAAAAAAGPRAAGVTPCGDGGPGEVRSWGVALLHP
jgi:hypothetical protein